MKMSPIKSALGAGLYIVFIATVMQSLSKAMPGDDTFFAPMLFLSLLVLSVAIMGYLFVYEPLRLFLENQKKEALSYFAKTVSYFAVVVVFFLLINLLLTR
jgi:hypothetical protein